MGNNIILIGMPTSGKSTAGVILAKVLGMDFLDTDILIQRHTGQKLNQIIKYEGLHRFLEIEEEVCLSVDVENTVIATGGSVCYGSRAMEHFKDIGRVVYLDIKYKTMMARLDSVENRGVVLKEGQTLAELYKERCELYERYADVIIFESEMGVEQTVRAIKALY